MYLDRFVFSGYVNGTRTRKEETSEWKIDFKIIRRCRYDIE